MTCVSIPEDCANRMREYSKKTGEKIYAIATKAIDAYISRGAEKEVRTRRKQQAEDAAQ